MNLSGPGFGPFPPIALWINILGYMVIFTAWIAVIMPQGDIENDLALAGFLSVGLLISCMWAVLLPMLAVFVAVWGSIKVLRFVIQHVV